MSVRTRRVAILIAALFALALMLAWLERGSRSAGSARAPNDARDSRAEPSSESRGVQGPLPLPPAADSSPADATSSPRVPSTETAPPAITGDVATLAGRVVDGAGNPVAGVRVLALFAVDLEDGTLPLWKRRLPLDVADPAALGVRAPRETRTTSEGRFELESCPTGRFRLALRSPVHAPLDLGDLALPAPELDLGDIALEAGVVCTGYVSDMRGRPIEGAKLARGDDFLDPTLPDLSARVAPLVATSGEKGAFRALAMPIGRSILLVRAPVDPRDPREDPREPGAGASEVRVELDSSARADGRLALTMPECVRIGGFVTSQAGDRTRLSVGALPARAADSPVPCECRADFRAARLESNGAFALDGLAPDELYDARPLSPTQRFEDLCPWSRPALAIAGVDDRLELVYKPDGAVSFELVDARTHGHVDDFAVELQGATPADPARTVEPGLMTRERGFVRIEGVRPLRETGRFQLALHGDGFSATSAESALVSGSDAALGPIFVETLPVVEVVVRDAASGRPIAGARVQSSERDPFAPDMGGVTLARTDPRGVAHVVSLLARDSAVTAHAAGFAPANKLGAEIARAGSTCTLELQRGLHARVRVVDSGGVPMGGVRVRHGEGGRDPGGVRLERDRGLDDVDLRREETRVTDRDGACTFADLGRGTHTFALERDRALFDGEWAIQDVVADDTTTVTLVTRGLGEILGRVTDGKLAIPGARVALFRAELAPTRDPYVEADGPLPAGMDTAADSRGRFRFQNVDPGAYELAFAVPGQSLRVARVIAVDVGARNVAVDVARDAVDGEVRRADGAPASGAAIWVVPRDRDARADALRRRISNGDDVFGLELDMRGFPSDSEHPAMFADAAGRFRLCGLAHNVAFTLYASDGQNSAGARALSASRRPRDEHDVAIQLEARGAIRASIGATPWRSPLALVATHPSALPRVARVHGGLALALPALEPGTWELTLREERAGGRWIPIGDRHELEIRAGASETLDIPYP